MNDKSTKDSSGRYTEHDHTFVICAYKESPYLEETIVSLKRQTVPVQIIMSTATPNEFIENMCRTYEIPLYVNQGAGGRLELWLSAGTDQAGYDCSPG